MRKGRKKGRKGEKRVREERMKRMNERGACRLKEGRRKYIGTKRGKGEL